MSARRSMNAKGAGKDDSLYFKTEAGLFAGRTAGLAGRGLDRRGFGGADRVALLGALAQFRANVALRGRGAGRAGGHQRGGGQLVDDPAPAADGAGPRCMFMI